jgi:hypothetical protein
MGMITNHKKVHKSVVNNKKEFKKATIIEIKGNKSLKQITRMHLLNYLHVNQIK